ncbi:glycoside hydrolase N-terminal domain-containing protein [Rapidithrix thailandica]|uniref:Glycoside hydrolase N-terminal domain-containing protein n=1 Tax=Rapidithrix thailandica TaxID=413964 RepID=A0AAW9S764_9BACT
MKMKKILYLLIPYLVMGCQPREQADLPVTNRGMWSKHPAEKWQDALVTGNGRMGALVFGKPHSEQIIFNHEFLYEYIGSEQVNPPDIRQYLNKTRKLIIDGKYKEATAYSVEMAKKEGYSGLLWTDPYHPAYAMSISQPEHGTVKNYQRRVNFLTGEVEVTWEDEHGQWSRKLFISRPDNIIVQQIKNLSGKPVSCSIGIHFQEGNPEARTKYLTDSQELYIHEPEIEVDEEWMTFRLGYSKIERGYEGVVQVIAKGAEKKAEGNQLHIKGAHEVLLISRINYLENFDQTEIPATQKSLSGFTKDYQTLLQPHAIVHGDMFTRTDLDFGGSDQRNLSSEELFELQSSLPDSIVPGFLEEVFDMGKYVLITSNGENPPNLMGIWTGEWRPMWCGDFTLDANVNLQVAGVNLLNLPEAIDSYMNLLERVAPDWEMNARNLYGARGFLTGTRTSGRRNLHTHFNPGFPGHFWIAGAQWLVYPGYEYYLCTGDRQFLTERLLPLMEKTALFYEDFLSETDEQGNYIFAPSYSPENWPKGQDSPTAINAVMDIAVAKQALQDVITVYKELHLDPEKIKKWEGILAKLPPYLINEEGALKEWAWESLDDNYDHRHASHMYPVWPAHEFNPEDTPELFKATSVALDKRGDGDLSAHGIVIKSLAASRLKRGDFIEKKLIQFLTGNYLNRSLVTNHNPGIIYNTDAINCFPGLLYEMLVYSKPGEIELLPALPSQLSKGSVKGVACRTRAIIDRMDWDLTQRTIHVTVKSLADQKVLLTCRQGISEVSTPNANFEKVDDTHVQLSLKKGETVTLEVSLKQ